jgi:hypothetical protein
MRKQKCCGHAVRQVLAASRKKHDLAHVGKRVLHVLTVMAVVAYTFFAHAPVDACFR